MKVDPDKFKEFVCHPRYGRSPRYTGLDVDSKSGSNARLLHHSSKHHRVPGTAIVANTNQQKPGISFITHYCDTVKCCIACHRNFIFFADEQRYWYETLKFDLGVDCFQCSECRKTTHWMERLRRRYEHLLHDNDRSDADNLELAECCITLVEHSVFGQNAVQFARRSLNQIPEESNIRRHATFRDLWSRSGALLNTAE